MNWRQKIIKRSGGSKRHSAQGTEHRAQCTEHRAQGTVHRAQSTEHRAKRIGKEKGNLISFKDGRFQV